MKRHKVLLADDHDIVIEGLRRVLESPDLDIVAVVKDGRALVQVAEQVKPDIIIVDISMPALNGIEAVKQIRKHDQRTVIIFLTMHPDVTFATEALGAGASGYVLKNSAADELVTAVRETTKGNVYIAKALAGLVHHGYSSRPNKLTVRQREVLQLLAEGHSVKEIAVRLKVSSRTVEYHKYRIMDELGLRSVAELSRYAATHGLVT
jgi:DNA-binding NarL/FixJ family response regulator